jgi:hypothetical protein
VWLIGITGKWLTVTYLPFSYQGTTGTVASPRLVQWHMKKASEIDWDGNNGEATFMKHHIDDTNQSLYHRNLYHPTKNKNENIEERKSFINIFSFKKKIKLLLKS